MSLPTSSRSDSEWAAAFQQAIADTCRKPVGAGWKTMRELLAEHHVCEKTMGVRLHPMLAAGTVERFDGTDHKPGSNRVNKQTWYRVAPKKK